MTWNDLPRNPSARTLRQFAGIGLLVFGSLGSWHWLQGRTGLGVALWLAAGAMLPGLLWPRLLRPIFVGWMMAVFPIGWLVSHILLAMLYYGVFTPLAVVFRLRRRDALRLQPIACESYWTTKTGADGIRSYFRQF